MYYYRLDLDQKGHTGQGRKTSPCLTLERLEQEEKSIDNMLVQVAVKGRAGLGYHKHERSLSLGRS